MDRELNTSYLESYAILPGWPETHHRVHTGLSVKCSLKPFVETVLAVVSQKCVFFLSWILTELASDPSLTHKTFLISPNQHVNHPAA